MKIIAWKRLLISASLVTLITTLSLGAAKVNTVQFKSWVTQMKSAPRGPFHGIRWFCKDGTILQPRDYSCNVHGGGVQHGIWTDQTKSLRAAGYKVANVFAGFDAKRFFQSRNWRDELGQILIERFLIGFDDGWIFRSARFYRGALQTEDEAEGARELLNGLFQKLDRTSKGSNQDFLLLREAYLLLPRQQQKAGVTTVRNLSTRIEARDKNFLKIRTKIHNQPDSSDAKRVRKHSREQGIASLKKDYEKLARAIDVLYAPGNIAAEIQKFAKSLLKGDLKSALTGAVSSYRKDVNDERRLIRTGFLLQQLRDRYSHFTTSFTRVKSLELSRQLEQDAFATANRLSKKAKYASRTQNLKWLKALGSVIYGTGLISQREWTAFKQSIDLLSQQNLALGVYRKQLHYLNRLPAWANHWLKFHFSNAIGHFSRIEPLSNHFIPDRLRSSPILAYGVILNELIKDANQLSGVNHQLFGETIGAGVRSLNPGMARGVLRLPDEQYAELDKNSIVLLPETTAELSPVAGILTMGEGNALSHVQLLAGNLGIPNVVISEKLQSLLKPMQNQIVVLAVSPGGIVQLESDSDRWHEYFSRQITPKEGSISPNLDKLDLKQRDLISLADLRAEHAGRIVGPKAANLGELKHHFPQAVTSGLVVPFGAFREHLNQHYNDTNTSVFEWMQSEYRRITQLGSENKQAATKSLQEELRAWILQSDPGDDFRKLVAKRLNETFGKEGSYAVFVRSDTNVEDLPGFTGAGLNLTVPNVRGSDNILAAIMKVWASPFAERAFAWRQQRMANPEHVYPSVLLMKSVAVDKSGVMLTVDTETGDRNFITIAVNNGIGGAVQGESAEELSIDVDSEKVKLLNDSTSAKQRVLSSKGGLVKQQLPADGRVLRHHEIKQLIQFSRKLKDKFPQKDDLGMITAADVEFGFDKGRLVLFQVRPFLQNRRVKKNHYLNTLDQALNDSTDISVNMNEAPSS